MSETLPPLDDEELAALEELGRFHQRVMSWGMVANREEFVAAIHVLQGFIIQRALQRLDERWGRWFER